MTTVSSATLPAGSLTALSGDHVSVALPVGVPISAPLVIDPKMIVNELPLCVTVPAHTMFALTWSAPSVTPLVAVRASALLFAAL